MSREYKRLEGERRKTRGKPSFITKTLNFHLNSNSVFIDFIPKNFSASHSLPTHPISLTLIISSNLTLSRSYSFPKNPYCVPFFGRNPSFFVRVDSFCSIRHLGFWKEIFFLFSGVEMEEKRGISSGVSSEPASKSGVWFFF